MKFSLISSLGGLLVAGTDLSSKDFRINIDHKTGALYSLTDPKSKNAMNWISNDENAPWSPLGSRWGLGYADLGQDSLHRTYWNSPKISKNGNTFDAVYKEGDLEVLVSRTVNDNDQSFTETYTFTNKGASTLNLASRGTTALAIYTPFNDHYTNTTDCVTARSHAHVWANGGSSSWVKLDQMGGNYRNLGLVLTKGSLSGYSIESRDSVTMSNTRGVFLLHPSITNLEAGASSTIEWTWFWHTDWDDFFKQSAARSKQFVHVETNAYTYITGETASISLKGASINSNTKVNGQAVTCEDTVCRYNFTAGRPARTTLVISTDTGYNSSVYLNTVPKFDDLLNSRTKFIIENQQDHSVNTPAEGSYRVFDYQANVLATWDTSTDRNPGRERVGMGILMARWLKKNPENTQVRESLEKYYTYVSTKLQEANGAVRDRPIGMDPSRKRLYNWPWVLQFHITVAALNLNLTGPVAEKSPIERFMLTLENFYAEGGSGLYAIGLPILESLRALEKHGNKEWLERAKELYIAHGEVIVKRGLDYPEFEVNFEQSIVAPAAVMLLELWRYTGDKKWLEAGKLHLDTMLLFAGKQPDYHLHDISIRHWDGFWFGKDRMWGDTFPHHWSTINAIALHHYGKGLGNQTDSKTWLDTADGIIRNNLILFDANGRGSCAYIYPTSVNGRNGNYKDPYANDQDWVLAHLLQIEEDNNFK
ncbi:six-hairpin glycosidase [Colletotrichum truncatum]|uniref:Six-hairpin glycosidase n=1 Tax=Colletotrichum truncatum TaxID=5467 RepID=A0ACC3Z7L2_COLTU|nr:six-hairpin glycosidase [Colletotrichum truncatum]KAF6785344.1 six-hairpin glycosidase [Colletotrichum truncatum]